MADKRQGAAAAAPSSPSNWPSRIRKFAPVVVAVVAVLGAAYQVGRVAGGQEGKIAELKGEISQQGKETLAAIRDLKEATSGRENLNSLVAAVATNRYEMRLTTAAVVDLIGRLHSNPDERRLIVRYAPLPGPALALPLAPEQNPQRVYARLSSVVPGMLAVTLPPEHLGKRVPVLAMKGGEVLSIETNKGGFKTLDIAQGFGYVHRYGNLTEVAVRKGATVSVGQVIAYAVPSPEACVRIGILAPEGVYVDPRPFLPPMGEPPEKREQRK